jgi:hypothetical protein
LAQVSFAGVGRFRTRIQNLGKVTRGDVEPLLEEWERIIVEDNRKGILAGLDKDGLPAPPLKYRNAAKAKAVRARPATPRFKDDTNVFGVRPKRLKGITNYEGKQAQLRKSGILPNNNLATWLYRTMTGQRLAPRGDASRSISNLRTGNHDDGPNRWIASAGWVQVRSVKGFPFLDAHFNGKRQRRYDLRGVRLWGRRQAAAALRQWARAHFGTR